MDDFSLKVEHVSKKYRLGQIGAGTLRGDLQSLRARILGKDDPNIPLYKEQYYGKKNRSFKALDDVSFTVMPGESLGLIGLNGAGKSTLLKIISGITLPSEGSVTYKGRIASMLEVGTGFHSELTGRENVYMNGAILGMTKAEIDEKIEDIIDFSETREFIDTPVKRYSSGMYVKLAFAVAAHLDADILLMDEVLAVGDAKFQDKCLNRMNDVAGEQNRTIIYVSHNMHSIRQFCNRCIVLDKGRVVFDGETEKAIDVYTQVKKEDLSADNDLSTRERARCNELIQKARLTHFTLLDAPQCRIEKGKHLHFTVDCTAKEDISDIYFRLTFVDNLERPVASAYSAPLSLSKGENHFDMTVDAGAVAEGVYTLSAALVQRSTFKVFYDVDNVPLAGGIDLLPDPQAQFIWSRRYWGRTELPNIKVNK